MPRHSRPRNSGVPRPSPLQKFKAAHEEATDLLSELEARLNRTQTINPLMEEIWSKIYEFRNILQEYERVRNYLDDMQKFPDKLDKLDDKNVKYVNEARKMKEGFEKEKKDLGEAWTKALKEPLRSYMEGDNMTKHTRIDKSDPLIEIARLAYSILWAHDAVYADKVSTIWESMCEATRQKRASEIVGGWKHDLKNVWNPAHGADQSERGRINMEANVNSIKSRARGMLESLKKEESRIVKDMKDLYVQLGKDLSVRLVRRLEQHPSR